MVAATFERTFNEQLVLLHAKSRAALMLYLTRGGL